MQEVHDFLQIEELRAGFLKYTRNTYSMLATCSQPRILDIGCGAGLPTLELARSGAGEIVGIDVDASALATLRARIEAAGLSQRVAVKHCSLSANDFPDASFDVLWSEGVLHMLDASQSLPQCARLLKPDGFLVAHETIEWFDGVREDLAASGLTHVNQLLLPKHYWWTDYGAPLEERIQRFRDVHGARAASSELTRYENEVAALKENPGRFDCGFFIMRTAI